MRCWPSGSRVQKTVLFVFGYVMIFTARNRYLPFSESISWLFADIKWRHTIDWTDIACKTAPILRTWRTPTRSSQSPGAKMKLESEIKERNYVPWKTDFEKENWMSLSLIWSLEKILKKKAILTIQKQKLTNGGFCDTKQWPAPVFTTNLTNLFLIHSRQRADGMACDLVLSAQGAMSALCIGEWLHCNRSARNY